MNILIIKLEQETENREKGGLSLARRLSFKPSENLRKFIECKNTQTFDGFANCLIENFKWFILIVDFINEINVSFWWLLCTLWSVVKCKKNVIPQNVLLLQTFDFQNESREH